MKVLAYSIKSFEKKLLAQLNQNKHEITFIRERLNYQTADYAKNYDAILIFTNDDASTLIVSKLAELNVKYIITRSVGTDHIDLKEAKKYSIHVKNVPTYSPQAIAEHTITLAMALARKLIPTYDSCRIFNFKIDDHMGFNFYNKTVGLIGLGHIGQATATIFKGLGCRVLGYDIVEKNILGVERTSMEGVLEQSDIISLHVPFNAHTHHLINKNCIAKMRTGVMLINTSRGSVINTIDLLDALVKRKIGHLGLDVYEFEKGLFFEDHQYDKQKDPILAKLMSFPNVVITPHQAFLTKEAVQEITIHTMQNINECQTESLELVRAYA